MATNLHDSSLTSHSHSYKIIYSQIFVSFTMHDSFHPRDWHFGTAPGKCVSMAVSSPGSYGIPEGTMYSFPVNIVDGKWQIVEGLKIDDFAREKMDATLKELSEEAADAMSVCEE